MKKTGIGLLLLLIPLLASAAGSGDVMRQALDLYGKGEKERAIQLWEGLHKSGYASVALFYNLGNAYRETGQLGKAVLNYERALLVRPRDAQLLHNYRLAVAEVEGDPLSWPEPPMVLYWRQLRGMISSNAWAVLGLGLCWAALASGWWGRKQERGWPWLSSAAAGLLLALLAWSLAFSAARALESDFSVVLVERLPVRVGPDEQSGEAATAYEGWKVRRLDQIGAWVKIELPEGQEGWAPESGMESL
jgi:tetratricopeptide (TPR) repeat protein